MLALLGLAVVGLALHVAWVSGFARGELNELINHWIYNGVLVLAAAVCVLRAVASPEQRSIWLAFGIGVGLWAERTSTPASSSWVSGRAISMPSAAPAYYAAQRIE